MSKKLEEIINDAMELGLEERAQLAGSLLLSLDEPSESEVERLWLQEAERRLQEYRDGKVKGIPAEEVVMPQEGSTLDRKDVRVITGFTFSKIGSDPENWIRRAKDFKEAAELIAKSDECSQPIPYYFNSGLALELALKAVAIAKSLKFETNHRLVELCKITGVKVSEDQACTLELFSEIIVWSGRYPVPKKEEQWDNYHDVVQEKHIVREKNGNFGRVKANRNRFPTLQNFIALWNAIELEYMSAIASRASQVVEAD